MNIETGGPAFPAMDARQIGHNEYRYEGMSLRDYFAAKAMQSFITQGPVQNDLRFAAYAENMATFAYLMADAMLAARGKG